MNAAELDLKYTTIRSPVNGIVVARNVEVGQTVAASFATPNLFLIALDLTKMQVDTNVSESDIGGITEGKEATFTVDAYPGVPFAGTIRQVRLAPINVQNVVTYNVVVDVDNQDLRLKPGMTANVSIVVAQRDDVLKVPNAALRFIPPKSELASRPMEGKPSEGGSRRARGPGRRTGRPVRFGNRGQRRAVAVQVQTGISDGTYTEIVSDGVADGDEVIVGIDQPRGVRKAGDLPPGFGAPAGSAGLATEAYKRASLQQSANSAHLSRLYLRLSNCYEQSDRMRRHVEAISGRRRGSARLTRPQPHD